MQTRSKSGIYKPNMRYALNTTTITSSEPKTVRSALKDPEWLLAMNEEMEALHITRTYDLVAPTPGMNILGCKWVFKTKLKADISLNRIKARLVAKGFEQEEGIDFLETFSPVVRSATIRIVLTVAVTKQWKITQLDVKNAFLHGDLNEPVYMIQPPGFIDQNNPQHVCKLNKALYGLKQAPRAWYDKFSNFLLEFGFLCNKSDPSLFIYNNRDDTLILMLYVDDIILTGNNSVLLQDLMETLNKSFSMTDMGSLHYFLGIQIQSHQTGLFLTQHKYAEDILHSASMSNCNPMPTPLPLRIDDKNSESRPFSDPTYFRSLTGKLQYLTLTRPDIQFSVNFVCQRMHSPTNSDYTLLKRILRYIKGTSSFGIHISNASSLHLQAFSDSDWAGCAETRRSTTGFCTFLGNNIISWCAKRQPTVSKSSTEAEYRAMASTAAELSWISSILRDIGVSQSGPTFLLCDNLSAVYLTTNPGLHQRSKHIEVDYHYIREQVALGVVETRHIPSQNQIADILTKSLPKATFMKLRDKLGVCFQPTPSLRGYVSPQMSTRRTLPTRTLPTLKPTDQNAALYLQTKERKQSTTAAGSLIETNIKLANQFTPLQLQSQCCS